MQVGVPGGRQRNLEPVRDKTSQNADVAGAGDVNNVRFKGADLAFDFVIVAQKVEIEVVLFVEPERYLASRQFNAQHASLRFRPELGSTQNGKERQPMAASKSLKVPAGVGHAVHLVISIGE
jgi:hypothetical protein